MLKDSSRLVLFLNKGAYRMPSPLIAETAELDLVQFITLLQILVIMPSLHTAEKWTGIWGQPRLF